MKATGRNTTSRPAPKNHPQSFLQHGNDIKNHQRLQIQNLSTFNYQKTTFLYIVIFGVLHATMSSFVSDVPSPWLCSVVCWSLAVDTFYLFKRPSTPMTQGKSVRSLAVRMQTEGQSEARSLSRHAFDTYSCIEAAEELPCLQLNLQNKPWPCGYDTWIGSICNIRTLYIYLFISIYRWASTCPHDARMKLCCEYLI